MKNANEMTEELQSIFDKLNIGEIDRQTASEMTNAVGKMIGLAKVQLEYQKLTGRKGQIPFLETEQGG